MLLVTTIWARLTHTDTSDHSRTRQALLRHIHMSSRWLTEACHRALRSLMGITATSPAMGSLFVSCLSAFVQHSSIEERVASLFHGVGRSSICRCGRYFLLPNNPQHDYTKFQAAQYDSSTGTCFGLASVPPMRFALDNSTLPHTLFVGLFGGEGPRSVALRIQCDPFASAPKIKSISLDPAIVYVRNMC